MTGGGFSKVRWQSAAQAGSIGRAWRWAPTRVRGGSYSFEYTYAKKKTTDQILRVDLPAVAGFKQQWRNTGALESKTHELTFATQVISTPSTSLTLNIVGDRTRQVITRWDLPERLYSYQQMPAAFFLGSGSNLGVLYGNGGVRNIDERTMTPTKGAVAPGRRGTVTTLIKKRIRLLTRARNTERTGHKYTYCKVGMRWLRGDLADREDRRCESRLQPELRHDAELQAVCGQRARRLVARRRPL